MHYPSEKPSLTKPMHRKKTKRKLLKANRERVT